MLILLTKSIFPGFEQNLSSYGQDIDIILIIREELLKIGVSRKDMHQRAWNHVCWVHGGVTELFYSNGNLIASITTSDHFRDAFPFPAEEENI